MGFQLDYVDPMDHEGFVLVFDSVVWPFDPVAWCAGCVCGWRSTRVYYADDGWSAENGEGLEGEPDEVHYKIWEDWERHGLRFSAACELRNASKDLAIARTRLDDAVHQAREQGISWGAIGPEIGMTRQSAHERWSHLDS